MTPVDRVARALSRKNIESLVRFGLVGVANTAVYYAFYRLGLVFLPYLVSHLGAWALSVIFSFFANCWFTYHVRPTWRRFLRFPASTLINVAFSTLGSLLLVEGFGMDKRYATLVAGVVAVPFTYVAATVALTGRHSEGVAPSPEDARH